MKWFVCLVVLSFSRASVADKGPEASKVAEIQRLFTEAAQCREAARGLRVIVNSIMSVREIAFQGRSGDGVFWSHDWELRVSALNHIVSEASHFYLATSEANFLISRATQLMNAETSGGSGESQYWIDRSHSAIRAAGQVSSFLNEAAQILETQARRLEDSGNQQIEALFKNPEWAPEEVRLEVARLQEQVLGESTRLAQLIEDTTRARAILETVKRDQTSIEKIHGELMAQVAQHRRTLEASRAAITELANLLQKKFESGKTEVVVSDAKKIEKPGLREKISELITRSLRVALLAFAETHQGLLTQLGPNLKLEVTVTSFDKVSGAFSKASYKIGFEIRASVESESGVDYGLPFLLQAQVTPEKNNAYFDESDAAKIDGFLIEQIERVLGPRVLKLADQGSASMIRQAALRSCERDLALINEGLRASLQQNEQGQ